MRASHLKKFLMGSYNLCEAIAKDASAATSCDGPTEEKLLRFPGYCYPFHEVCFNEMGEWHLARLNLIMDLEAHCLKHTFFPVPSL